MIENDIDIIEALFSCYKETSKTNINSIDDLYTKFNFYLEVYEEKPISREKFDSILINNNVYVILFICENEEMEDGAEEEFMDSFLNNEYYKGESNLKTLFYYNGINPESINNVISKEEQNFVSEIYMALKERFIYEDVQIQISTLISIYEYFMLKLDKKDSDSYKINLHVDTTRIALGTMNEIRTPHIKILKDIELPKQFIDAVEIIYLEGCHSSAEIQKEISTIEVYFTIDDIC